MNWQCSQVMIVLLLLLVVMTRILSAYEDVTDKGYDHLVYIGDSLLRYQLLVFLYQIQFNKEPPTNLVLNEFSYSKNNSLPRQKRLGWQEYFKYTTDIFGGHMKCDCFRGPIMGKSIHIFENRFYSHPNGKFHVSYFQKFGDSPAKGKKDETKMRIYNNLQEANEDTWWAPTYPELFLEHVRHLIPPPTVVILNQKAWVTPFRKSTILKELPGALKSALEVVDKVLWLQGAMTKNEAIEQKFNHSIVDSVVRDVLCNRNHPQSIRVERDGRTVMCTYVDFPHEAVQQLYDDPENLFADAFHYTDPTIYLLRNNVTLLAAGVKHYQ